MSQHLLPNSKEWFAALRRANARQAAHTRRIVNLAGTTDVCSLCGDYPAHDYQVVDRWFEEGVAATIRLCDDCLEIHRTQESEEFVPLSKTPMAGAPGPTMS